MIQTLIQKTIDAQYKITLSGKVALYIEHGLQCLPTLFGYNNIDEERVVDYIVYQIYRCRSAIEQKSWNITWLFSPNSQDKFKKQYLDTDSKTGINYYIDLWLSNAGLSRSKLTAMISETKPNPLKRMIYLPSEEPIKKRFLNTPDGLVLCQNATTGWSPLSEACGQCDNWIECGRTTARKYPELMRLRKEEYGRQKKG